MEDEEEQPRERSRRFADPDADPSDDTDRLWEWLERRARDRERDAKQAHRLAERLALIAQRAETRQQDKEARERRANEPWCRCGHPESFHENNVGACRCGCELFHGRRKPGLWNHKAPRVADRFVVKLNDSFTIGKQKFPRERTFVLRREADRYAAKAMKYGVVAEIIVEVKNVS